MTHTFEISLSAHDPHIQDKFHEALAKAVSDKFGLAEYSIVKVSEATYKDNGAGYLMWVNAEVEIFGDVGN